MDADAARSRLQELLQEIDVATVELQDENAHESSELTHFDNHPADTASEVSDGDREDASLEALAEQRVQVVEALARVEQGTFGQCIVDGAPIEEGRLEARPEAARCLKHQEQFEATHA